MKRLFALVLVLLLALSFTACAKKNTDNTPADTGAAATTPAPTDAATTPAADEGDKADETEPADEGDKTDAPAVMTYAEFAAAEIDSPVVIETYVQAHQSWWDNQVTVYCQSEDGACFLYNAACSEEDAAKLVPGTAIRVTGYKSEWAGEVEITDATIEFIDGSFVAEPTDVTALLGTDELIAHQNEFVSFKGMTVEAYDESGAAFAYKNPTDKTDDLYFKVSKDGQTYEFCVEFYLCGNDTDVYKAVEAFQVGDTVDLEGFLYWYEGANPHITSAVPAV